MLQIWTNPPFWRLYDFKTLQLINKLYFTLLTLNFHLPTTFEPVVAPVPAAFGARHQSPAGATHGDKLLIHFPRFVNPFVVFFLNCTINNIYKI